MSHTMKKVVNSFLLLIFIFSSILMISQPVQSMPLSPEAIEKLKQSGELQKFIDRMSSAKARGVCQAIEHEYSKWSQGFSSGAESVDTFRVIVLLADFSDHTAASGGYSATQADFEHLLFSDDSTDGFYSMKEFYYDNSYHNFIIEGVVSGWYRLPQTYAYYVDGQNGFGSYPHNAQRMTEDAVNAADPFVDYSLFDNDNNGTIDGLFVVHSGGGAEAGGTDNDIWSHAWSVGPLSRDGVTISSYTTEPEELYGQLSTMGVYAHEFGHFIGLPDLYDTDYSSAGIGRWSLMAGGSWNSNGAYPAFFDAWCKKELGFLTPINVTTNLSNQEIPTSYYDPIAYRIWQNGTVGQEYFLIENRQKTNKDSGIPGSGLLIYHIDESVGGNWNEPHYLVAVEQADGNFDLENDVNGGDSFDPWSTSTQTEFSDITTPDTKKYNGLSTDILVWDISASDSLMYANLDVNYSSPNFTFTNSIFSDALYGNNNGVAEAGETITFNFSISNAWLTATNVTATMTSTNGDIIFTTPSVNIGTVTGNGGVGANTGIPIVFDIPATYDPCIDSFFVTITSDNPLGEITQGFELQVGIPDIVIIDDDGGDTWEQPVVTALSNLRVVHDVYDKSISGPPSTAFLNNYKIVIWITGSNRPNIFSPADVTAMQGYMDAGGNILLSGQSVAQELSSDDLTFIQSYFKAEYWSDFFYPEIVGLTGTAIGDGIKLGYDNFTNQTSPERMNLSGVDGIAQFQLPVGGVTGVSYEGTYKSLLLSFGIEGISNLGEGSGYSTQDTVFARVLQFFDYGDVNTPSNPNVDLIQFPNEFSPNNVADFTPTFLWTYADTTASPQAQYQVQVGSGVLCTNANDLWDSGILSGTLDSIEYNGSLLYEGETYYVRVRVYNGTSWSTWTRTSFTMNIAPVMGTLQTPTNDIHVATNMPQLVVSNGTDGNGDALLYDFDVATDLGFSNIVASTTSVTEGGGTTAWTVNTPLSEDTKYYWRARATDGAVYTSYTATGSFYVNQSNQSPTAFSLQTPVDSVASTGTTPTFTWSASSDADAGDSVLYALYLDVDESFSSPTIFVTNTDNSYTPSPLSASQAYAWKVVAYDVMSDSVWSSETFVFNTGAWNTAPSAGTLVTPTADVHVATATPQLVVNNGSDINGDMLTYDFEVDTDPAFTSIVASTMSIPEGVGTTAWTVDVSLSEDVKYYWRSRITDGLSYSSYTSTGSFYVNAINQAPLAFDLLLPGDTASFVGVNPTFTWHTTTDADAGDSVVYTLMYSEDSMFTSPTMQSTATDTSFAVVSPLTDTAKYYWKVFATDLALDTTYSSATFSFNTGPSSCCIGIRGNVDGDIAENIDISDLVYLVDFMFTAGPAPLCEIEANVDADVSGNIDISDLVALVDYMFTAGPAPSACF